MMAGQRGMLKYADGHKEPILQMLGRLCSRVASGRGESFAR
ncbi:MAG: hypothetical protein U0894_09760 [Pirellulales bacterium]